MGKRDCPDCGASPGELHRDSCDVERCRNCGGQYLSCNCPDASAEDRLAWSGEWPGLQECRALGWYARLIPGKIGWHSCSKDDPGAREDLNRLYSDAVWSKNAGRFIKL